MDWFGVRRIALATPYPAETQRNTVNFLRAHDIDIVKEASMDVGFRAAAGRSPAPDLPVRPAGLRIGPGAEALYIPCPQWQVQETVESLEHDLGVPVIAGDPAEFWAAFRSVGIRDRIEGFGRLLRSLSEERPARSESRLRQAS